MSIKPGELQPGAYALLILNRAGWHTTGKFAIPPNITVLPLPPRAPESNAVENIWQFIRNSWLSNRVSKSYDEIIALCCKTWKKIIEQPWKIMPIGQRKWAEGFGSMLAGIRLKNR